METPLQSEEQFEEFHITLDLNKRLSTKHQLRRRQVCFTFH